jgi:hypothetical protein
MTTLALHLRVVAFAVWSAIHPGVGTSGDGPAIATATAKAVAAAGTPVYASLEDDVAIMAYWAWHESNLNLSAVNPTGRSWGAWQQDASVAKGTPALVQALAWYKHLRYGVGRCKNPAAIMWGACNFKLVVTPFGTAEDAADARVKRARALFDAALERLP